MPPQRRSRYHLIPRLTHTNVCEIASTKELALQFLSQSQHMVILSEKLCPKCSSTISNINYTSGTIGYFTCYKKASHSPKNNVKQTVTKYSFFHHFRHDIRLIIHFVYWWTKNASYNEAAYECKKHFCIGNCNSTARRYFTKFRQIARCSIRLDRLRSPKIGGQMHRVVVDETKLVAGRQSYWVLGMKDIDTNELRLVSLYGAHRSSRTLIYHLKRNINKRSVIISDDWKGYRKVRNEFWEHVIYNKSRSPPSVSTCNQKLTTTEYRDLNTNSIEAEWSCLKRFLRHKYDARYIDEYLYLYLWMRRCNVRREDMFLRFFQDLSLIHPPCINEDDYASFIDNFHNIYGEELITGDHIQPLPHNILDDQDVISEEEIDPIPSPPPPRRRGRPRTVNPVEQPSNQDVNDRLTRRCNIQ